MKKIEGIIPHESVQHVMEQLRALETKDLTRETVTVLDRNHGHTMTYRGCVYQQESTSRTKLEFLVTEDDAAQAEEILAQAADLAHAG
jgi:nitrogen regulatory protein PII